MHGLLPSKSESGLRADPISTQWTASWRPIGAATKIRAPAPREVVLLLGFYPVFPNSKVPTKVPLLRLLALIQALGLGDQPGGRALNLFAATQAAWVHGASLI